MELRHDAWTDPKVRASLLDLFEQVWPSIRAREAHAAALGFPWSEVSTATVVWDGERVLAHAGLLELPMRLAGVDTSVGGIHAVCTHPAARRQGHAARALARAVGLGEGRHPLLMLGTDLPAVYQPWGFRGVTSHAFLADTPRPPVVGTPWRRVARVEDPGVRDWLRLLDARIPLSDHVAFLDRGAVNVFDAVAPDGTVAALHHCADLDVMVYASLVGDELVVDDLVAAAPFDPVALFARCPWPFARVRFHTGVDRLGLPTRAVPRAYDGVWMVRGPFVGDEAPWALPPYSEC